ncbi:BTAD domain-containing putative transcriptional regulator [Actinokineospora sp. 24-640]
MHTDDLRAESHEVRVRALGALELVVPGNSPEVLPFRSGKPRRLLAALLIGFDTVVSSDALAEVIWGDSPPVHVDASLQTVMSRLRNNLRAVGLGAALLTRQPGYLLHVDPEAFDVTRFRARAREGRELLGVDPARAAARLDEGLRLWRGPAFAEFTDDAFAAAEVANLDELRIGALEDRAEVALALDRPTEAIALLERIVAESPLRERPRSLLMLALYRDGRQADALSAFRRYRTLLAEQLALEPSTAVRELEGRILRQDPALLSRPGDAVTVVAESVMAQEWRPPGNIPSTPATLVGRDDVLAQMAARLRAQWALTLTGPGGVGKTRLAVAAAQHQVREGKYPDGVWLVELAPLTPTASVADAVLTVLAVQRGGTTSATARLVDYLRPRRMLLVLDNCEHVVEAVADLVHELVSQCPDLAVLTTSRVPLGIEAEQINPVQPLSLSQPDGDGHSDAVRLFLDRARSVAPAFKAEGRALEAVSEVCRRLDGMPLAIELAAGRMRFMTPAEIVECLPDRFRFLRNPYRLAAERHQTLQTVVDWSYQLLSPEDQVLFERLSVFAAGFTALDAAAVSGIDRMSIVERIGGLVDRSMVVASTDDTGSSTTYFLLETLRAFGRDRLAKRGDAVAAHRAHAERMHEIVRAGEIRILAEDCGQWIANISKRIDDVRTAHSWALEHDLGLALRLVVGLVNWAELQMPGEIAGWAEETVQRWESSGSPQDRPLAGVALAVAVGCARYRSDFVAARALADRAEALLDEDDPRRRYVGQPMAELALLSGDLGGAVAMSEQVVRWSEEADDDMRKGYAVVLLCLAEAYGGNPARGLAMTRELRAETRSAPVAAWTTYLLGEVILEDDPARAEPLLSEALALGFRNNDRCLVGAAMTSLASVYMRRGDPRRAVPLYREVVEHWNRTGNWLQQWAGIRGVVFLLARLGDHAGAVTLLSAVRSHTMAVPEFGADAERLRALEAEFATHLGGDEIAALSAEGADMGVAAVLRLALDRLAAFTEPLSEAV